ncbi:MAG: von Willebrand factor type A domain-containing protein [Ilumatobacter sp.]|uniref:vWA domain-containing protein n=1 Tax=Ilumatobacter sp. TaxID=1967498 RepID=UPI00262A7DDC|nr:VWA domain-containing protein [Ilumatobacter sp.]MDJ0770078.1 von Willebrand factor type A domain-containing protein [Ilumatobacter sp.]
MKRSNVNTTAAVLAAITLVLAACSGDDDDAATSGDAATEDEGGIFDDGGTSNSVADSSRDENSGGADDAEADFDDSADVGDVGEADMAADEGDAMTEADESGDVAADSAVDTPASGTVTASRTDGDAEGGLFGAEPEPRDADDARLEDNTFEDYGYRDFIDADDDPLSTFALDVDTGSYTVMRRWLDEGTLPPRESVRPEEYINAFDYDYDTPRNGLELSVDGGPSPFDDDNYLVRIGVQGEIVDDRDRGPAALTFVIDTSGSMDRDDRLGLVKESLTILVDELDDDDTVAIVTYDDSSGVVLEPTSVGDRDEILDAIDRLRPGGSTNLEAGLREGYALADDAFQRNGINRVILASDGVANVGVTDPDELARMIRDDADRGINLVTVGFGMGNFNDVTMEQLADQGDGFYAYVDTEDEAERLFEDELTSTLLTIAKDAKIQVEFDPEIVEAYRLIGFENRGVLDRDFRDDDVDAGELGAGHQVTAIYEVELERGVDLDDRDDVGEVFLRWEDPDDGDVIEIDEDIDLRDIEEDWRDTPEDFQLATVVTVFAEVLRDNPYADRIDIDDLVEEADRLADELNDRDVDELADLIELAADLS